MEDVKIGDLLIRYKDDFGTLAMDFYLDLDMKEEELQELSNLLTKMNDILIPKINEKAKK